MWVCAASKPQGGSNAVCLWLLGAGLLGAHWEVRGELRIGSKAGTGFTTIPVHSSASSSTHPANFASCLQTRRVP